MAHPIEKFLHDLEGKLQVIDANFDGWSKSQLEKRWAAAESLLELIWNRIEADQIDPDKFEERLSDIHASLNSLDARIEGKHDGFWQWLRDAFLKALDIIDKILDYTASYVSIGRVARNLLEHKKTDKDGDGNK